VMEDRPNAMVVPTAAIQSGIDGSYVWVVDPNAAGPKTAKRQVVKVELAEGQVTILDSGVQPGQYVVVDGSDRLRPGQIVQASTGRQGGGRGASQTLGGTSGRGGSSGQGGRQEPAAGADSQHGGTGTGHHHQKEQQ